ncbi:NAD-dependent epimerase/dehydratase family protein [Novosphingobium sp. G106]|uniref:NAD-dependent epimerase/dehydratase family protein n=1 Tax=Novosphingobium sp. G106 TaxID=2849500 RepID=UPI001C2D53C2|nr:NAD-dependent epimerase/dehydratase family protein [Novosphingobium sp. G106]MBV1689803.1 NAD-dependent epimerase/dehydratase family protein [Novosphingobium sp. G106]
MTDLFLIAGGAGFIGQKLTENLLARGARVRILDSLSPQIHGLGAPVPAWAERNGIEFIHGSVTERSDWLNALDGATAVAHLAAETGTGQSMYEIARYNEVNSQGTALLFDILAQSQDRSVQKVVLTSSRSVYGEGRYRCTHCGTGPCFPRCAERRGPDGGALGSVLPAMRLGFDRGADPGSGRNPAGIDLCGDQARPGRSGPHRLRSIGHRSRDPAPPERLW